MTFRERKVCTVSTFQDITGRTVKRLDPYIVYGPEDKPMFIGKVRIKIVPLAGDSTTAKEKDFEFPFTDDVKTVEQAFDKFDEICQKRVDENNTKMKMKLTEGDQNVLPLDEKLSE